MLSPIVRLRALLLPSLGSAASESRAGRFARADEVRRLSLARNTCTCAGGRTRAIAIAVASTIVVVRHQLNFRDHALNLGRIKLCANRFHQPFELVWVQLAVSAGVKYVEHDLIVALALLLGGPHTCTHEGACSFRKASRAEQERKRRL